MRFGAALLLLLSCSGCGAFIEYADDLRNSKEHTILVRGTAQLGGVIGVIAGIPLDIVALPVTYPIYLIQKAEDPENSDFSDSILFPTFALRQVGSMIAVPVDLLEYAFYRAWQPPDTLTAEEQEELERRLDDEALPRYPVTPVYPLPKKS